MPTCVPRRLSDPNFIYCWHYLRKFLRQSLPDEEPLRVHRYPVDPNAQALANQGGPGREVGGPGGRSDYPPSRPAFPLDPPSPSHSLSLPLSLTLFLLSFTLPHSRF